MSLKEGALPNILNKNITRSHAEFVSKIAKRANVIHILFRQHTSDNLSKTRYWHRLMTLYLRGGGELNKSMGRGVAGPRTVNYHEKKTRILCASGGKKNRSGSCTSNSKVILVKTSWLKKLWIEITSVSRVIFDRFIELSIKSVGLSPDPLIQKILFSKNNTKSETSRQRNLDWAWQVNNNNP